jgi:hypothetical protein
MALTLREASKEAFDNGETLRAAIIKQFAEQSDILDAMPFMNISGNAYRYNQEASLPGIAFRGVNEATRPRPASSIPKSSRCSSSAANSTWTISSSTPKAPPANSASNR